MSKLPTDRAVLTGSEYEALAAAAVCEIAGLTKAEKQSVLKGRLLAAAEAFDGRPSAWNTVVGLMAAIQKLAYAKGE